MISQSKNRVQAIKSKFENLSNDTPLITTKNNGTNLRQLVKHVESKQLFERNVYCIGKENSLANNGVFKEKDSSSENEEWSPKPNQSYLHNKNEIKRTLSDKKLLTRQTSDPGKKLHRSHAFRCDRSQKILSPKRHGSCNGRSETSDFSLKMEKRLSKDRLKRLGNLLEDQMRKENFVPFKNNDTVVQNIHETDNKLISDLQLPENLGQCTSKNIDSIPDSQVPQHILDQYAKVVKPKKEIERKDTEKQDAMTDSGVSSETENLEEEKTGRIKKLMSAFEKNEEPERTNLESMTELCNSSDTIRLERKNPNLVLTDTLKKALKQPLPLGPPPRKPPRTFIAAIPESPEKQKKDTKKMLQKLEQVLKNREAQNQTVHEYDSVELTSTLKPPKEIHYLCTEILDITHKTLLPNQSSNCFKSLNCAITSNSTLSLPYTRLSNGMNRNSLKCCSCSNDNLLNNQKRLSSFLTDYKCNKCEVNETSDGFKCHLNCKCRDEKSKFFIDSEHIYDEPFNDIHMQTIGRRDNGRKSNGYGTLNHSKSMEDLRHTGISEDQKIYDIPCEPSKPATPEPTSTPETSSNPITPEKVASNILTPEKTTTTTITLESAPKTDFERLRQNFETGFNHPKPIPAGFNTEKPVIVGFGKKNPVNTGKFSTDKPPMRPKPVFVKNKLSKSIEDVVKEEGGKDGEKEVVGRHRRLRGGPGRRLDSPKKDNAQLDVDRENLNRLMNEIYETVTQACSMEDNKLGSFPTDQSDSTSEDSVKLTRSLTEKRKNYVRRVSSRCAYIDKKNLKTTRFRHQTSICSYKSEVIDTPYSTFRSWKSFRTSQSNLAKDSKMADLSDSKFNLTDSKGNLLSMKSEFDSTDSIDLSIDGRTGCVELEHPFERDRGLFSVCLLVGLNYMTGQAYVKSVFPNQVQVPPHIENLIFPETLSSPPKGEWSAEAKDAQCYSLVLTDERGERSYGYCRRVLPEGASACLPLCYCIIGKYRAPGFYYKVLQEIESHHGSSDVEIHSILQQLFETDFPDPGEEVTITYTTRKLEVTCKNYRNSINLGDILKCKTMPDLRHKKTENADKNEQFDGKSEQFDGKSEQFDGKSEQFVGTSEQFRDESDLLDKRETVSDKVPQFYDLENNNGAKRVMLSFEGPRTKTLKRPIEPRVDEVNLSILLDCLGAGLTVKVFGSLLLERKVLIVGDKLSLVSSCMEALQNALYPFVWQQPLISSIPAEIQRDVLEAPLPMLAGMLRPGGEELDTSGVVFEEGMLIDLTHPSKVLFCQGDESTILPSSSYKTLKTSLQMERKQRDDQKTKNIMISESFLRFFVDVLGDFWGYFGVGELKEGGLGKGDVVFEKDAFIKSSSSKQNQYFLEWFTETAMFNHFIQNMSVCYHYRQKSSASRTLPNFTSTPTNCPTIPPNFTPSSPNLTRKASNSPDLTRKSSDLTQTSPSLTRKSSNLTQISPNLTRKSSNLTQTSPNLTRKSSNFTSTSSMSEFRMVDTPLPNFYELFEDRVKSRSKAGGRNGVESKSNYKSAVNKRVKLLKNKLRELVT